MASRTQSKLHQAAAVAAAIVLLLSWAGLLHTGEFISWSLAPYDTTPLVLRPPSGTWEREVSDFFEAPPGSTSVGVLIVGLSVLLFLTALRRVSRAAGARTRLMAGFAASNVLVGVGVFLSILTAGLLPLKTSPYPGYGWTVKFLVPQALLLAILYTLQAHTIPKSLAATS